MTVKELIKELQQLDQNLPVVMNIDVIDDNNHIKDEDVEITGTMQIAGIDKIYLCYYTK